MPVTLYHFPPSGPSRGALLAARAVGVPIELNIINLFQGEHLKPEFIKVNPQHCVPTIDDDGFVLWESRAIASYLVRTHGKEDSLYPKNNQLKAVVDQRLYFDAGVLYPRVREICFPVLFLGETKISEAKKKSLNDGIALLETFLHGRKWVCSDTPTIADTSCYASLSSIVAVGWDISGFPNVTAWLERCKTLPGADENEEGAKQFAEAVRKNLEPGQI